MEVIWKKLEHEPPQNVWCLVIYSDGRQDRGKFVGWLFYPNDGTMYTYAEIKFWREEK